MPQAHTAAGGPKGGGLLALQARYGRDYAWLEEALRLYGGSVRVKGGAGCVSFRPGARGDMAAGYGLAPGVAMHFLLEGEEAAAPADWRTVLAGRTGVFALPIKSGRAALGWQLGLRLWLIRPLALLRPFYLFLPAAALPCCKEARSLPLADTRALGRLLEDGFAGTALEQGRVRLQRRAARRDGA